MPRSSAATASYYDDLPLSLVVFRYLWPFWLFRDASRGDRMARAAAYRYNRGMRVYLPGYLLKWSVNCAFALAATFAWDGHSQLITAGSGMVFAGSLCVLFVTGYIYLYLDRNED